MFRLLFILSGCVGASASYAAEPEYSTTCVIEDGEAIAYMSVRQPSSLSFSGEIDFYTYDEDDERLDKIQVMASVSLTSGDLEEIKSVEVYSDVASCAVDVSHAIGEELIPYMTTCFIEYGEAVGYVQSTDGAATRFSGRVKYFIFDADGDYMKEHLDQISVVLVGRDRKEAGSTNVDDNDAAWCLLDVSRAVR